MSGGEQQRLALACALVGGTPLVLADEPTGALDDASAEQVVAAMLHATSRGATIVAATHDANVIAAAHTVIRLDHGRTGGVSAIELRQASRLWEGEAGLHPDRSRRRSR